MAGNSIPVPVVLFKTLVEDDPYRSTLGKGRYDPTFVSVLEESYNVDELVDVLRGDQEWEAVVVSSKRGAEGWVRTVKAVLGQGSASTQTKWSDISLWSVGQASLDVLSEAQNDLGPRSKAYFPHFDADGSTRMSKSASVLIPNLIAEPPRSTTYKPYLIIRGDKSLEDIPRAIQDAGRKQRSITVYATSPREDLPTSIGQAFDEIPPRPPGIPLWLAFFSPSSAAFVLPHIPQDTLSHKDTKIFAIGETTRTNLEHEHNLTVHAVADEPTAQGMLDAIRSE